MKIGMILLGTNYPPDIRVEKETSVLCKNGYPISLLTEYSGEDIFEDENYLKNLKIIRKTICSFKYSNNIFIKMKEKIEKYIFLIKKNYIPVIYEFIEKEKPDILHVHDFKFLPTVFFTLKIKNIDIPVVIDLHENFPAALVAYRSELPVLKKIKKSIQHNIFIWRYQEKTALKKCKKIITVVPEANERLIRYGINPDRIAIISNTENADTFKFTSEDANKDILVKYKNDFILSYIGGIGPHRGLKTVFRGLKKISEVINNFKLLIVGAKDKDIPIIEGYIKKNDLYTLVDKIEIIKWIPFKDVNSFVLASDICLVPHEDFEHTQTTIPHKLFQYMICERPVLVSDCRPLKRIIGSDNAGYVFKAGNAEDFADKCIDMYNNPEEVKIRVANAKRIVNGEYSWNNDSRTLLDIYIELDKSLVAI